MQLPFTPLSSSAVAVMNQLFLYGPVWDGNLVSKEGRDELMKQGLLDRWQGWSWLNSAGVELSVTSGGMWSPEAWRKKASLK